MPTTANKTKTPPMFSNFIGQSGVKKKLAYWIESHNNGYPMPVMIFLGAKGHGKTQFAEESFNYFLDKNGKKKPHCIVNCSQFQNADQFFQEFIAPIHGVDITILLDECHCLPKDLQEALLTPFNPNGQTVKNISWKGEEYEIDLKKQTFIFATTEPNKMLKPLMERLKKVVFARYSDNEIGQIIESKIDDGIDMCEEVIDKASETCRKSPRLATEMVDEMMRFASHEGTKTFNDKTWKKFIDIMSIRRYGVDSNELEVLKVLSERGACSLNEIASSLNMTPASVQRSVEEYLLNMRFLEINGKRHITKAGREALKVIMAG